MLKTLLLVSCTAGWAMLITRIGAWVVAGLVTVHWNVPVLGTLFTICL